MTTHKNQLVNADKLMDTLFSVINNNVFPSSSYYSIGRIQSNNPEIISIQSDMIAMQNILQDYIHAMRKQILYEIIEAVRESTQEEKTCLLCDDIEGIANPIEEYGDIRQIIKR